MKEPPINQALTEDIQQREKVEQELSIFAHIVTHTGYAVIDQALKIQSSNAKFKDWIEDAPESILGQLVTDMLPELIGLEEDLQEMLQHQAGLIRLSKIYRPAKQETDRYFNLQIEPLHASDSLLVARIVNVTAEAQLELELRNESNKLRLNIEQRRQAEQALKESERRLIETQQLAHLGSWDFDMATETCTWSAEMFRIAGLDPQTEEPSMTTYLKVVHPDDVKLVTESFRRAKSDGTAYNIEVRHLQPDGQINYVTIKGQPIIQNGQVTKLIGYMLDITERKRAEQVIQAAHDELAQRVSELALLNNITQTVATVTDLPAALNKVAREMVTAFNARNCGITLINNERTQLEMVAGYSKERDDPTTKGTIIPLADNLAIQKVLETKRSVVIDQAQANHLLASIHKLMKARQTKSIMIVPLLARGDVIGTIGLGTANPDHAFTPAEMTLAETIAGQIAGAIEVARLFEEEHRQRQMADSLRQVGTVLSSSLDLQTVLDKIMAELRHVINYDSAGLSLQDRNKLVLLAKANLPDKWNEAHIDLDSDDPAAQVYQNQTPMIIDDLHQPPYDEIWAGSKKVRGWMGVPLRIASRTIGVLGVDSYRVSTYSQKDANLLQIFANQAAGAIQNAQLHQQIRREKQLFETLLFNSPVATVMVLPHTFEVTSWSPAAEKLFGYTWDEVVGQNIYNLVTNDTLRPQALAHGQQVSNGQPVRAIDKRQCKDGRLVDVEMLGVPVMIDDEQVAILVIYYDITELEQARQAAEMANRAKSEFLSNMSHELRTPLNAIIGFSHLMMQSSVRTGQTLPKEFEENLHIINRSGEHLLSLINNVLSLSKIEAGQTTLHPTNFDLQQMLDDLEAMFRLRAQAKSLQLSVERTATPQFINADEIKLRQVLINLLNNALKFTDEGRVILRIQSQIEAVAPIAEKQPTHQTPLVIQFEVEDTGLGIVADELATIFDAFVQTRTSQSSQEGTGLGLTISYQFVQLMGGELSVSSELGQGTVFRFDIKAQLAATSDKKPQDYHRRVVGLAANQTQFRILIVDDSQTNRRLMTKLLLPLGFEVKEARDGQEAITIWQNWEPHLIWMDMRMPVMDGYEATQKIKATTKGQATAVIALTASTFEEEQVVIVSAGCDDFLRKPFREADIFNLMQKHIGVNYVYEEIEPGNEPHPGETTSTEAGLDISQDKEQLKAAISALPNELVTNLENAATRSDMLQVDDLIAEISYHNQSLANWLNNLAQDFEYDGILALLQTAQGGSNE